MASHPPGKCCTIGVKHEGTAVGEIKNIGNFRAYYSYPQDKKTDNAILFITDIFGMDFINSQLIADQYAANGYFVIIPDLFNKNPAPLNLESFDLMGWLGNYTVDVVDPIVAASLQELRNLGAKHIGAVGHCFGAKYVCRFLKKGQIDAGYIAHPSFVTAEELQAIEGPLSISAAETDDIFPVAKRHESEEILQKVGQPYQLNLFSHVSHGFAVRCDLSDKRAKWAKEQAFLQAVHWFDEYIKA